MVRVDLGVIKMRSTTPSPDLWDKILTIRFSFVLNLKPLPFSGRSPYLKRGVWQDILSSAEKADWLLSVTKFNLL